jgi:hypothetical protein
VVLADAAYGNDSGFREGLVSLELSYTVGIQSSTTLWPPGITPLPPQTKGKMGRPPRLLRRDKHHQPLTAKELALCLSATDQRIRCRARREMRVPADPLNPERPEKLQVFAVTATVAEHGRAGRNHRM